MSFYNDLTLPEYRVSGRLGKCREREREREAGGGVGGGERSEPMMDCA